MKELVLKRRRENLRGVVHQYTGISLSAVVTNYDNVKDCQLINFRSCPSVSCSGSNRCTCSQDKKCIVDNCAYYSDSCNSCTMTVNGKLYKTNKAQHGIKNSYGQLTLFLASSHIDASPVGFL